MIMEALDTELVECPLEEGISSNRGEEVQSFSKHCGF